MAPTGLRFLADDHQPRQKQPLSPSRIPFSVPIPGEKSSDSPAQPIHEEPRAEPRPRFKPLVEQLEEAIRAESATSEADGNLETELPLDLGDLQETTPEDLAFLESLKQLDQINQATDEPDDDREVEEEAGRALDTAALSKEFDEEYDELLEIMDDSPDRPPPNTDDSTFTPEQRRFIALQFAKPRTDFIWPNDPGEGEPKYYEYDDTRDKEVLKRERNKEMLERTNKPIPRIFKDAPGYDPNDPWPMLPYDRLIKKLMKASQDPHFDFDTLSDEDKRAFVRGPKPTSTYDELVAQKPWLATLGVPFDSLSPKAKELALETRIRGGRNRVIPPPNGKTVESFLTTIGKDVGKYHEKFESWEHLFLSRGRTLKEMDIPVRQRRHILSWIEKHKQGMEPFRIILRSKAKKNKERKGTW